MECLVESLTGAYRGGLGRPCGVSDFEKWIKWLKIEEFIIILNRTINLLIQGDSYEQRKSSSLCRVVQPVYKRT